MFMTVDIIGENIQSPVLQVLLVSAHEHLAPFVFVHQKWQQGFQLQLINGLSLAVCYIISSFKERIQKKLI